MVRESERANFSLPEDVVEAIDEIVGKQQRSRFILEAVEQKLLNARQLKALRDGAGVLADKDYPHWSTPEKTSEWVRELRRQSDESRKRAWCRDEDDDTAPA